VPSGSSLDVLRLTGLLEAPEHRGSPAAIALQIDWQALGGRPLRVRVTRIRYPPEASGGFTR